MRKTATEVHAETGNDRFPHYPSVPVTIWTGCYDQQWTGVLIPDCFKHPAKMARGLVTRILEHGIERGYWARGMKLGDPFGGIGTTAVAGADAGFEVICQELEAQFVEIGNRNIEAHREKWERTGRPVPVLVQGDSRKFAEAVAGIVTSPPFTATPGGAKGIAVKGYQGDRGGGAPEALGNRHYKGEGGDRGDANIEKLKPGTVDGAVTSPPYADSVNAQQHGIDWSKVNPKSTGGRKRGGDSKHAQTFNDQLKYGEAEGQIGALKAPQGSLDGAVTSPPYDTISAGAGDEHPANIGKLGGEGETCHGCGKRLQTRQCQTVKIAELLWSAEAAGVSDTIVSTSEGRASRKAKSTSVRSQPGTLASQTRSTTPSETSTGMEEAEVGEVTLGKSGGGKPSTETATSASAAEQPATSLSTMSRTSQKPEENGITVSQIFRRYAEVVTRQNTPDAMQLAGIRLCAKCAVKVTSRKLSVMGAAATRVAERLSILPGIRAGGIGRAAGETYFEAMAKVYASTFAALRPGGYMAVVVKDYVRDWKRVPLCDDTLRLLQHVGFEAVERIRAMVVEETTHGDLFEGTRTTKKERKSFFRRLQEKRARDKGLDTAIDYEEVLIVRKPA